MMTNKEMNAMIKKELKTAGYKASDFSVSVKDCGYSTSIQIKIESPKVNRKKVADILNHWKEIKYDQASGEILEGCNTYLL